MRYAFVLAALTIVSPAAAAPQTILCDNGMHPYQVLFDEAKRTFTLNGDIKYSVLAIEKKADVTVVVGTTVNDGPTFRAFFGQRPRVEYFSNSKIDQTDKCRVP